jgi:hypothetical protein
MNWAHTFMAEHPELARWPVRRQRSALSFESPGGERYSVFGSAPAHWWSPEDGWQEIDTTLRRRPNGGYGAPGLPVAVYADGSSQCGGYMQRTHAVGVLTRGGQFRPLGVFGEGRCHEDQLIRQTPGFRHEVRVTADGLIEELHVERELALGDGEMLATEFATRGHLPSGYHAGTPVGRVDGKPVRLSLIGRHIALNRSLIPIGTILDPDYSASANFGYVDGANSSSYATARGTSVYYGDTALYVGQEWLTNYTVYRAFVQFDTSAIPDLNQILKVNLSLAIRTGEDYSDTDFDVQIVKQSWSSPLSAGNQESNYDGCLSGTADNAIWRNTSGLSADTYYASGDLDPGWVAKTGTTYYALRSSRDYANSTPTNQEWISLQAYSYESKPPFLTVSHVTPRRRMLFGVGL